MKRILSLMPWALMGMWGLLLMRLALSGEYLHYVKPNMKWWLVAAGAAALVGACLKLWEFPSAVAADHDGGGRRISAMLVVPILSAGLLIPSAGPWLAQRQQTQSLPPTQRDSGNLPAHGIASMRLDDYYLRSLQKDPEIVGREVRLIGFVSTVKGKPGWYLSRLRVNCCVADALTVQAHMNGGTQHPDGVWVAVEGAYEPLSEGMPQLKVSKVDIIDVPEEPMLS